MSVPARTRGQVPEADNDHDANAQATLKRAVFEMGLSNIWAKYGATMVCTTGGGALGHAFCLAQLAGAVYGGFAITHPAFYAAPTALAYGVKKFFDRVKPPKSKVERRQRRNLLVWAAGSSALGIGWDMRYHMGVVPGGSYGKDFKDLSSAQQEYLKGEIGLYYFPQLSDQDRQKIHAQARAAGKDPVAYVFDRDSIAVMDACRVNREKDQARESKMSQPLARPFSLN